MAYLIGIPVLVLLAILQSTVMSHLELLDGRVDLVLLAVVSWGLAGRNEEAMVWGVIGGFCLDLLSGIPFGSTALILLLVAFLVSLLEGRFWEAHFLMPLGVMLLASLTYHVLGTIVALITGRSLLFPYVLARIILPSTFLNVVISLPASQMATAVRDRIYPQEVEI